MDHDLYELSEQIGARLLAHGWQLSVAESCTGGWLAHCITDVAGSSQWFETGFVTYSNAAKQRLLAVPSAYFIGADAPGAVSAETVVAMARGALQQAGANFAIATSGIAGPGGGSASKPVGTVWIAWAWRGADAPLDSDAQLQRFTGDRDAVRRQTVQVALTGLLQRIDAQIAQLANRAASP